MSESLYGGMDLSGIAEAQKQESEPAQAADYTVHLTAATLQSVMQQSLTVPVIVLFTMDGLPGSTGQKLEAETKKRGGRFQIAVANAQTETELMAAFQVSGAPSGYALIGGRSIVPLFQGEPNDEQLTAVIDQVLELARQAGIGGRISGDSQQTGETAGELEEHYLAGVAALQSGDLTTAEAEFRESLNVMPDNEAAKIGLAQVDLVQRTAGVNREEVLAQADEKGAADPEIQLQAADIETASGRPDLAFDRLIATIAETSGDEREKLRKRLLELFEVVGADQPIVAEARKKLARALF
ncbi:co-chaperone YbbN [Actinobaculum suis]|uniref:co-chaperone YbbN n=1 Tax=Actinobaculum suis TaxID=1657 RepID=UPI00066FC27F|nr:tetratricopeptide repeat protein [Actinobaculum suis]